MSSFQVVNRRQLKMNLRNATQNLPKIDPQKKPDGKCPKMNSMTETDATAEVSKDAFLFRQFICVKTNIGFPIYGWCF